MVTIVSKVSRARTISMKGAGHVVAEIKSLGI